MRPHPASLILLWLAFLLAASMSHGVMLLGMCAIVTVAAASVATIRLVHLLRRSRWLILTLVVLFGWMTPGTPLEYVPGASREGLALAVEHAGRLLLALAALALVLRLLSPVQIVAGLRVLLMPLGALGIPGDRLAVRLALTLEEVERVRRGTEASASEALHLPRADFGVADLLLALIAMAALVTLVWPT